MNTLIRPCLSILIIALALAAPALMPASPAHAQDEIDLEKYSKVKAAFVLNFVRYVTWPETSFREGQPLIITVVGTDPFHRELDAVLRNEEVAGRKIQMQSLRHPDDEAGREGADEEARTAFYDAIRQSHVLFIARSERLRCADLLSTVEGSDILTVSDINMFAQNGGMLELAVRDGRVAFDANTIELGDTKLQASSKLLRLAKIVTTRGRE